ncbi:MAG: hypothetical protein ACYS8X_00075 [Planctomycetota bacterium]|jgi:hypothetical protein
MAAPTKQAWNRRLVKKLTCPNCWHAFSPEQSLFIAKHPELIGDPLAGNNEFLRFEPLRFNVAGEALDPRGFATTDLACPRCHLSVPEALLEISPLFISTVGSPASGKSYFLTSMIWNLRRLLPTVGFSFSDADPAGNNPIYEYEEKLFLSPDPDSPTEIRKTQRDDPRLYRTTMLDGVPVRYPVPLQFTLWPTPDHPRHDKANLLGRVVVVYDNAGEDFLPAADAGDSPVVQHLARSNIVFMFFDPTQDPSFRSECSSDDPQLNQAADDHPRPSVLLRQETLLREAAVKVRRYLGLPQDQRVKTPLIVIVSKADVWSRAIGADLDDEPYATDEGSHLRVDLARIERVSDMIREHFRRLCPEFVASADSFSEWVRYIPVSALGGSPELIERDGHHLYGVRPRNVQPKWVTVPLLYSLAKWTTGMIGQTSPPDA